MKRVVSFEVVSRTELGTGGFLVLHRYRLRNVYDDGSRSAEYPIDYVDRPRGIDAVALALYRHTSSGVEVLIRGQLRPPLQLGRARARLAVPESELPLFNPEIVAGLVELEDEGLEGLKRRATLEAVEEAGYAVAVAEVVQLGAATFPAAGAIPEKHFYFAADVTGREPDATPDGDGSPVEDSHDHRWLPLDEAIAGCTSGAIPDSKSEIALRRLRDLLVAGGVGGNEGVSRTRQ